MYHSSNLQLMIIDMIHISCSVKLNIYDDGGNIYTINHDD